MSGGIKTRIPLQVSNPFNANTFPVEHRIPPEKRAAAVKLLMTFYNKYPLRPEEEGLMDERISLLQFAERGWFKMLRLRCDGVSIDETAFRSALTLLEG